jgi:tRNA-dihydrouridine synthase
LDFGTSNPIQVSGDLILSPMDGYSTCPSARSAQLGSPISYTEFISAIDVLGGINHVEDKLVFAPAERPVAFQIFDNDPDRLLEAALRLQEYGPDFIDINLGCSDRASGRGVAPGCWHAAPDRPHLPDLTAA